MSTLSKHCPACGSNQIEQRESAKTALWIQQLLDEILEPCEMIWCGSCGSSYFDQRYNEGQLEKLYSDYRGKKYNLLRYGTDDYEQTAKGFLSLQSWNLERREQIENFLSRNGVSQENLDVVFDIGGSTGDLIPRSARHPVLVDMTPRPTDNRIRVSASIAEYFRSAERSGAFTDTSPAVLVMLIGVLEHVSEPEEFLKSLRGEVGLHSPKSMTKFVVQVPAGVPEQRLCSQKNRDLVKSEHQTFFSSEGLKKLLNRALTGGKVNAIEELQVPSSGFASELASGRSLNALVDLAS